MDPRQEYAPSMAGSSTPRTRSPIAGPSTSTMKRPRPAMIRNMESPNGSFSAIRRTSMVASTPRPPTSAALVQVL